MMALKISGREKIEKKLPAQTWQPKWQ